MDPDSCDGWDLRPPPLPSRSRLYHLAPIGVGTPVVESLTGYLARLSEAHCVSPRQLAHREIAPMLGVPATVPRGMSAFAAYFHIAAYALNGVEEGARRWAAALAELTGRRELRFLTLRPWAAVLPSNKLLRRRPAWCPSCYDAWADAGQPIYQPLRWAIAAVTACPDHGRPLRDRCPWPDCRRHQPLVRSRSGAGSCHWCDRWLGAVAPPAPEEGAVDAAALAWQGWVGDAVGALLAAGPALVTAPGAADLAAAIDACAKQVGGAGALGRQVGVRGARVTEWRAGRRTPCLPMLLHLCHRLGTTPLRLLTEGARPVPSAADAPPQRIYRATRAVRFDVACGRELVRQTLREPPASPPAVRHLARQLACDEQVLRYHFPAECRAISARFKAHRVQEGRAAVARRCAAVRQAVLQLHAHGVFPSQPRVAALLARPATIRHPEVAQAFRDIRRELGYEP